MVLKVDRIQKTNTSIKDIIFVPYRDFYFVINIKEIIYIKAEKSYCKIVLKCRREYLIISSMRMILKKLPDNFIRTHNSYIVNMFYAATVHGGSLIKLNNNAEIPISRRRRKVIFDSIVTV